MVVRHICHSLGRRTVPIFKPLERLVAVMSSQSVNRVHSVTGPYRTGRLELQMSNVKCEYTAHYRYQPLMCAEQTAKMTQLRSSESSYGVQKCAVSFYRAMLRRARYCYGKLSVCPSVCPSVRNVEVL